MLVDRAARHHAEAAGVLRRLTGAKTRLVTTSLVVVELQRLTLVKANRHAAQSAVARLLSTPRVEMVHPTEPDLTAGLEWIDRFADHDFTLTDAISFAVMERLAIHDAFAYDRDFAIAGFEFPGP